MCLCGCVAIEIPWLNELICFFLYLIGGTVNYNCTVHSELSTDVTHGNVKQGYFSCGSVPVELALNQSVSIVTEREFKILSLNFFQNEVTVKLLYTSFDNISRFGGVHGKCKKYFENFI